MMCVHGLIHDMRKPLDDFCIRKSLRVQGSYASRRLRLIIEKSESVGVEIKLASRAAGIQVVLDAVRKPRANNKPGLDRAFELLRNFRTRKERGRFYEHGGMA
jgi:hypothetical protein